MSTPVPDTAVLLDTILNKEYVLGKTFRVSLCGTTFNYIISKMIIVVDFINPASKQKGNPAKVQ